MLRQSGGKSVQSEAFDPEPGASRADQAQMKIAGCFGRVSDDENLCVGRISFYPFARKFQPDCRVRANFNSSVREVHRSQRCYIRILRFISLLNEEGSA